MKNMQANLLLLYNAMEMFNKALNGEGPIGSIMPPLYISTAFNRQKVINNIPMNFEIDKLVNVGEASQPFFIAIIDCDQWVPVVDRVAIPIALSSSDKSSACLATYLVMLPKKLFNDGYVESCAECLFSTYRSLLSFDHLLSLEPCAYIIDEGDSKNGCAIPTYDYELNIDIILYTYQSIINWFGPDSEGVKSLYYKFLLTICNETTINDIIDTIISKCGSTLISDIESGHILNIIYQ